MTALDPSAVQATSAWPLLVHLLPLFFLGLAVAGQTIYAKFGSDAPHVFKTWQGILYWISRGVVPVTAYCIWYVLQDEPVHSWRHAAGLGLGSEVFLRSRFYLGERRGPGGKTEEISKGLFDLLSWYQALCLKTAGDKLAHERQQFIENLLGTETDFLRLARRAHSNANAWAIEEVRTRLQELVEGKRKSFEKELAKCASTEVQNLHRDFVLELGYAALHLTGRESLKTLFK